MIDSLEKKSSECAIFLSLYIYIYNIYIKTQKFFVLTIVHDNGSTFNKFSQYLLLISSIL